MTIRLKDFLISVAVANGIKDHGDWPYLRDFMEWFLGNCAAQTVDTACGLFWMRAPGTSVDDYTGVNAPSLVTHIMTLLYPSETEIRPPRVETYDRQKKGLTFTERLKVSFGAKPIMETAQRYIPPEIPVHFTTPERRRAFVGARLKQICANQAFRNFLVPLYTTAMFGMRFVTDMRLTAPNALIGKSGPRPKGKGSRTLGSLAEEAASDLAMHGAFDGVSAANEAGVQIIHHHLGGKVSPSMISKAIGPLDQFVRQAKRRKSKVDNSGN
jgi:hypothetical protein